MFRYLLFDLDGTLANTGPGITGCVQHTLTRLGWPPQSQAFLQQFIGPPLTHSFMTFCHMDEPAARRAIEIYRARYQDWGVYQSPLYPGIKEMLARLDGPAALCVATSKRESGARQILEMRGIEERFSVVVGDDGTRPAKAAVIGETLRLLGEPPREQVAMIGDRSYDIEGAKAWGVRTIGVEYGFAPEGELQAAGADWTVESVSRLEALCMELTGAWKGEKK